MKKYLFPLCTCLMIFSAQAQMVPQNNGPYNYSYAQDRINQGYHATTPYQNMGYNPQDSHMVASPASPQVYGFYQQPIQQNYHANVQSRPQMMWYPTRQQVALANGQVYTNPVYDMEQDSQPNVYQSPVYNSKAIRQRNSWYADLKLGVGVTMGWKKGFDKPISPVWGIAIGKKLSSTLRADVEFAHHLNGELVDTDTGTIEYKQYELGANVYYDFPVRSHLPFRPFVGAGIWGVKARATATSYNGKRLDTADSNIKLGLSATAGVIYPINEMFSLLAMARARYIVTDDHLYNLEGLVGVRYHF